MLISRTSRLAVEVLVEPMGHGSQEWMNAAELGRRIDVKVPFLKQVLNRLSDAGVIRSKRGRQGSFRLAVVAGKTTLAEVPSALDGAGWKRKWMFNAELCGGEIRCRLSDAWHPIRELVLQVYGDRDNPVSH